jgi:hypothetical protein
MIEANHAMLSAPADEPAQTKTGAIAQIRKAIASQ